MKNTLIAIVLYLVMVELNAQESGIVFPSFSPKGNISQMVGNTLFEFEYERPSVRKREIFGGLVPWNKVWRTGAGNCTKIKFDKDVKIGGQGIPKGTYSLFTIPNPKEWIVIINMDTTMYGSYDYNSDKDMVRFPVKPIETTRFYETLNVDFELRQNNGKVYISWANTQICLEFETSTNEQIDKLIKEELITGKSKNSEEYAGASAYLAFRGIEYKNALKFADKAFELDKTAVWTKFGKKEIFEHLKLYDEALIEIEEILRILEKDKLKNKNELEGVKADYDRINGLRQ